MKKYTLALALFINSAFIISCTMPTKTTETTTFVETISTEEVEYSDGKTQMVGYLALPKDVQPQTPAVIVVHEWWGQTDYPRRRARELAELGYIAMAIDMFGERKIAEHPKDAGSFTQEVMGDMQVAKSRFNAALETLKKQPNVDPKKINAIGYCFGGAVVITMAKEGYDLNSVVSFHGSLPEGIFNPKKVKANILVINGEADPFITAKQIESFKKQMLGLPTEFNFVNLPGAKHAFTNPDATENGKKFKLPLEYSESADKKSWSLMKDFLYKFN